MISEPSTSVKTKELVSLAIIEFTDSGEYDEDKHLMGGLGMVDLAP